MKEQQKELHGTVQPVQFSPIIENTPITSDKKQLGMLTDVSLNVSFELGRTKQNVREILQLKKGSIIRLEKLVGEHVNMLVNKKAIAQGEVVVVDDKFAVRITDIVSVQERERNMN
jgi:flagellar motor switch protein FliN/FliY